MARKKIPESINSEVQVKCNRRCCVCGKIGDQIHHIDGNHSNNEFDNLVFLCFSCHNEASVTNTLRRKLTPLTIKKFRDRLYKMIDAEFSIIKPTAKTKIDSEAILNAAITAGILIEFTKIKDEYYNADKAGRLEALNQFDKFHHYANYRISFELFEFLMYVADCTRFGMPGNVAANIHGTIMNYYLGCKYALSKKEFIQIGSQIINIGFSMTYDAFIKLNDYYIAQWGLSLFKLIYKDAAKERNKELLGKIDATYKELVSTLNRPERTDLRNAISMVNTFKEDIKQGNMAFPLYESEVEKLVRMHEKSN